MTRLEYYSECVASAAEECGAALTAEQIASIADAISGAIENESLAFPVPDSPLPGRIAQLERELATERRKVPCEPCGGRGAITTHGPYHSSTSQCWKCSGEGKHAP